MLFRTLLTSFGFMCAMTGTMMSETFEKGKSLPLKNPELKTQGIRFAQPAMNNTLIANGVSTKHVMDKKTNRFISVDGIKHKPKTSSTPFMKVSNTLPGILLGSTYYDLQTNGSMPHRVSYFEDGADKFAQVIWMGALDMDRETLPHPERGSFYAVVNVSDALNPQKESDVLWERIESVRSGFPSIIQYKDGSAGSIAHVVNNQGGANTLRITKNTSFGDINFTSKQITGADTALWAHSTVDGDDITHIIFTSDTTGKNYSGQVVYMRSTDKGNTWSEPKILTGPQSNPVLPSGNGGNSYQIATRGSTVAIAYQSEELDLIIMKSLDNGITWEQAVNVFGGSRHQNKFEIETYEDGTIRATTDTVPVCGASFDLVIDADNNIHAVAATTAGFIVGTAEYDNDGNIVFLQDADTSRALIYTQRRCVYYNESEGVSFVSNNEIWDGFGDLVNSSAFSGINRHFKLGVDDNDNSLYMVYTGVKNGDVAQAYLSNNELVDGLLGHIYVSKKFNGSISWEPEIDITPLQFDCQFPSIHERVKDGVLMLTYQADKTPGVSISNPVGSLAYKIEENFVYFHSFRPSFVSVNEQVAQTPEFQISPNPATDLVTISFGKQDQIISVTISDALGQTVAVMPAEMSSEGSVLLSTASFATGTYFCTIRTANGSVSKIFSIVR